MKPLSSQTTMQKQSQPPGLYLVATPIGNLQDITLRALDLLKTADRIVCEDTRVTAKLLSTYGIKKPTLSYHDHSDDRRRAEIIAHLKAGEKVALVSDAGTPLVSDPGYKLVRAALAEGCYVTALPGASSVLAGLSLSGLPTDRFFFVGFLPAKEAALKKEIAALALIPATLVVFESAKRLASALALLAEGLGDRQASVVRELTKLYEEVRRGRLLDLARHYRETGEPKGEVVIVIAPPEAQAVSDEEVTSRLARLLKTMSVKEAASQVAEETGRSRKALYALALTLK